MSTNRSPAARTLALPRLAGAALAGATLALACAEPVPVESLPDAGAPSFGGATGGFGGSAPGTGGAPAAPGSGGADGGGGSAGARPEDAGLGSDVFGSSAGSGGTGGTGSACDDSASPSCDFSRVETCCSHLACEKANGADVFNTYPIESCQALVACVQSNPGCSSASDPLCFGDEDPSAPCLNEGYLASHNDPDGPFAWTVALMTCLCGY